jgi:cytochrome c
MTTCATHRALLGYAIIGGAISLALLAGLSLATARAATGDPAAGAQAFGACAACHSLEPGRNRTGPSLAGVIGRRAGTAPGFRRYSAALEESGIVWDEAALDAWIADPKGLVPGNGMAFRGVLEPQARADLIACLAQGGPGGTMGMGGGDLPDLKTLGAEHRVTAIRRCADGYEVTTADGTAETFWETNLRFKTDGSDLGPEPGKPVIVGGGMVGDRASVVFAAPEEISPYILPGC